MDIRNSALVILGLSALTNACSMSKNQESLVEMVANPGNRGNVPPSSSDPENRKDAPSTSSGTDNRNNAPSTSGGVAQSSLQTGSLEGSWSTPCSGSGNSFDKTTQVFSGSTMKASSMDYSDANCSASNLQLEFRAEAKISIGEPSAVSGATNIDFTNIKTYVTPRTDANAANFNSLRAFGFSDWAKDVEKEISGKAAIEGVADSVNLTELYSIFKITGNALCSGKSVNDNDGKTRERRHAVLDTGTECLTKQ